MAGLYLSGNWRRDRGSGFLYFSPGHLSADHFRLAIYTLFPIFGSANFRGFDLVFLPPPTWKHDLWFSLASHVPVSVCRLPLPQCAVTFSFKRGMFNDCPKKDLSKEGLTCLLITPLFHGLEPFWNCYKIEFLLQIGQLPGGGETDAREFKIGVEG